ncbi:very-long-chain (3R)-3-hydroxyacyl-CoA dehydratase 4 isoform X3 [Lepidochelys kempii]|uniref:very-long-chain (3R)-3-hydroxyacyl-CoA dehydratase 4 isoform X3 n=1 Tax=Lepidochelys kempii TaxID=8472 RepID=UPI003C702786
MKKSTSNKQPKCATYTVLSHCQPGVGKPQSPVWSLIRQCGMPSSSCTMYTYLFIYYLIQFCGHSWIFTNMTIRFLSFGKDSLADTFYSIGFVMCLCQSLSILELLHILVGIEKNCFLPRFLQITERIIILFVISSQEEVQGKYIVCVLFFLWNLLDVVRYTYCMLSVTGTYYEALTWLNYTLWIPVYPLSILAKAFAIYESLPYFESFGTYSTKLPFPVALSICFPYILKMYLAMLFVGKIFISCEQDLNATMLEFTNLRWQKSNQ